MATRTPRPGPIRAPKRVTPPPAESFAEAFPRSTKVDVDGSRGVRVLMREIALSGGDHPLRVYDATGPQGFDVREGLPAVREGWIGKRALEEAGAAGTAGPAPRAG